MEYLIVKFPDWRLPPPWVCVSPGKISREFESVPKLIVRKSPKPATMVTWSCPSPAGTTRILIGGRGAESYRAVIDELHVQLIEDFGAFQVALAKIRATGGEV